ncbi:pentapeptide repeat-containing protein [Egbenema bharatensis]|uniref:pentapeptide repeat-containing protein n=1 Tax=Egbenema bharatensis TaxID=3463334 RepID=UPI003A87BBA8
MPFDLLNQTKGKIAAFFRKIPFLVWWFVGGTLVVLFLIAIVVWVPVWQARQVAQSLMPGTPEVIFEIENKARSTILQGLSGLGLSTAAIVALLNLRETEKNRKIAEDEQIAERFVKAVEMLADKKRLEVRLGGIYALERIAKDSPRDYWTIVQVLTSFIQQRTLIAKSPQVLYKEGTGGLNSLKAITSIQQFLETRSTIPKDVQVALTILGKREVKNDPEYQTYQRLDCSKTDLTTAKLFKVNFAAANFSGVCMSQSLILGSNYTSADLSSSFLYNTFFTGCTLRSICFRNSDLRGSFFVDTDLQYANFQAANLREVVFIETNLSQALLYNADLYRTDFRLAEGLTPEQVKKAKNWDKALYAPDFSNELGIPSNIRPEDMLNITLPENRTDISAEGQK